jgi:hypothetical protein
MGVWIVACEDGYVSCSVWMDMYHVLRGWI